MTPRPLPVALALLLGALTACQAVAGLGDFTPDDGTASGGRGGAGGASSGDGGSGDGGAPAIGSSSASSSSDASTSTASIASSSASSGGGCGTDHLVISEVRTRGPDGGNQDFIELFNPTDATVTLDATWKVQSRGEGAQEFADRWAGDPAFEVGPGQHVLLANVLEGNPLNGVTPDATYDSGIPDGASVILKRGDEVVDVVCFVCTVPLSVVTGCEGTPLQRPEGCELPGDRSVQRKAAGGVDGCADTDSGEDDLADVSPSTPTALGG